MNYPLKLYDKIKKSLISKGVTMGTMKAELCKQIWEETYMGQLE